MENKQVILLLLLISLFASCTNYIYKQNKNFVLNETTYKEFDDDGVYKNKLNLVQLENDVNNYKIVESQIMHADGAIDYIYAFRNDTLIYFGYPYQFSQSSDPTINELGKYYSTKINDY